MIKPGGGIETPRVALALLSMQSLGVGGVVTCYGPLDHGRAKKFPNFNIYLLFDLGNFSPNPLSKRPSHHSTGG